VVLLNRDLHHPWDVQILVVEGIKKSTLKSIEGSVQSLLQSIFDNRVRDSLSSVALSVKEAGVKEPLIRQLHRQADDIPQGSG
jgi:hypothetical protein